MAVLEHAVAIRPLNGGEETLLKAGERAAFSHERLGPARVLSPRATAWTRGQIIAEGWRLGELAAELARYRPGILRCDPAVAQLRISGVFQVDDTDQALAIIEETLPVQVSWLTRYWVTIGAPG